MRIVAISDSHGDFYHFHRVMELESDADCFIFLGDRKKELDDIRCLYPKKIIFSVRGNCDLSCNDKATDRFMKDGHTIIYTHGHLYNVKRTKDELFELAKKEDADMVLYGHTHIPDILYKDGVYLVNPGSIGMPKDGHATYAVIDFTPERLVPIIKQLKD